MSTMGGYPPHDSESEQCMCRSCEGMRRGLALAAKERQDRLDAIAAAADLVVIHVTKDVFEMQFGGREVNGRLSLILRDPEPYEQPIIEMFQRLPLLEQHELLQRARDRQLTKVRVGDMKFSKDAEAEAAAEDQARREAGLGIKRR